MNRYTGTRPPSHPRGGGRLIAGVLAVLLAVGLPAPDPALARALATQPSPATTASPAPLLEQRIFPLLAQLRSAPGWHDALVADAGLRALADQRRARLDAVASCSPQPLCRVDAWRWTAADIAAVDAALRRLLADPARARSLVASTMRPSQAFAHHAALDDGPLLSAAWQDTAAGINQLLDVYAKGVAPRYPAIDSGIFDVSAPGYADTLAAHAAITRDEGRGDDTVFDPPSRYALGLLLANERTDAARLLPVLGGENAATLSAMPTIAWNAYPYTALLVFGHGPQDPASRTGVLGHLRLRLAAERFHRGQAPLIILSGGNVHPNRTPYNEALEMRAELVAHYGVPADRILLEPHARHTTTNLRNVARLLLSAPFPRGRDALILSDPATIGYIGGTALAGRVIAELGAAPGRIDPGEDALSLRFQPSVAAFHVDSLDPLDP